MGKRTGSADLPLHGGRVPAWLASRMARLGGVMVEAIAVHYGRDEVLRRLSHPFWFQSLGAVLGMDWHSSGITTSVLGALKRGLAPIEWELGLHVCGGRGKQSRKTPDELGAIGDRVGLDAALLARTSRLVAKVDSAAVQDGFDLYLHGFVVTDDGAWTVVQQGMNTGTRQARRYHWLSEGLSSFVDAPHAAIEGQPNGTILNLCDRRAEKARQSQLDLLVRGPDFVVRELHRIEGSEPSQPLLPHLSLPAHHEITSNDVVMRRLHGASPPRPSVDRGILPTFWSHQGSARVRFARSLRLPRSSTARPAASPIRRASPLRTAEKTATPFPFRSRSTTKRFASCAARSRPPSSGKTTSSARCAISITKLAGSSGSRKAPRSKTSSTKSTGNRQSSEA